MRMTFLNIFHLLHNHIDKELLKLINGCSRMVKITRSSFFIRSINHFTFGREQTNSEIGTSNIKNDRIRLRPDQRGDKTFILRFNTVFDILAQNKECRVKQTALDTQVFNRLLKGSLLRKIKIK